MQCHCIEIAYDNFVICCGVSTKASVLMTCLNCGKVRNLTEFQQQRTLADIIAIAYRHCVNSHEGE
jgi:hypothetical protein